MSRWEELTLQVDLVLPDTFPIGEADIIFIIAPKTMSAPATTDKQALLTLAGSLKQSPHFGGNPLLLQKALRDEWQS